jgi:aspartyl/asparaginyl-tRNA synthetase
MLSMLAGAYRPVRLGAYIRDMKNFGFIELNDGSCFPIQW